MSLKRKLICQLFVTGLHRHAAGPGGQVGAAPARLRRCPGGPGAVPFRGGARPGHLRLAGVPGYPAEPALPGRRVLEKALWVWWPCLSTGQVRSVSIIFTCLLARTWSLSSADQVQCQILTCCVLRVSSSHLWVLFN
jgi:hypothetical protein